MRDIRSSVVMLSLSFARRAYGNPPQRIAEVLRETKNVSLRMTRRPLSDCSVELLSQTPPLADGLLLRRPLQPVDSFLVGTWLSLVEHSLGVRGVGSSNLPVPTN